MLNRIIETIIKL